MTPSRKPGGLNDFSKQLDTLTVTRIEKESVPFLGFDEGFNQ